MPRIWVRIMLFISSYYPLTVIFALLNWNNHTKWSLGIVAIGTICLVFTAFYLFILPGMQAEMRLTVRTVERRDSDVLNYFAAYIIPFVTIPFDQWQIGVAVLILIGVLCIIYVNSNLIAVNPMLNLIGFHLYAVGFANDEENYFVLSRRNIVRNVPLSVVRIGEDIYLARKARTPQSGQGHPTSDGDG